MLPKLDVDKSRVQLHLGSTVVLWTACLIFDQWLRSCSALFAGGEQEEVQVGLRDRSLNSDPNLSKGGNSRS